ncbi:MAG: hypothetical protein ACLFR2_09525 [Candidatus Kapaibacterium sp.]
MVKTNEIYEELKQILARLGIIIKRPGGDTPNGLCAVRGRRVLLINRNEPRQRLPWIIARELDDEDLAGIFIKPALRDFINLAKDRKEEF